MFQEFLVVVVLQKELAIVFRTIVTHNMLVRELLTLLARVFLFLAADVNLKASMPIRNILSLIARGIVFKVDLRVLEGEKDRPSSTKC